jgi:hypothetical protein
MKPIEHMVGRRRDPAMNRAKTLAAVGKNRERGACTYAALSPSDPPLRTKAKRVAFPS